MRLKKKLKKRVEKLMYGLIFFLLNVATFAQGIMVAAEPVADHPNYIRAFAINTVTRGFKDGVVKEIRKVVGNTNIGEALRMIIIAVTLRIIVIIIVIYIGKKLILVTGNLIKRLEDRNKMEKSLAAFVLSLHKAVSYIIMGVVILGILGVKESSLATILGAAGVGIGFAAKDILGNFAGGVIILVSRPYKIGDFIEVDGKSGEVDNITIFATEMDTIDNKKIFVPNGKVVTNDITNYTANKIRRVEITFGIAYKSDFRKAIKILKEISENHDKVIQKIEKVIRVKTLDSSSVNILFRVWCKKDDYWDVHYDMIELAKETFDREGIEIPFPQMDVHVKKDIKL